MSNLVQGLNRFLERQNWLDQYARPVQKLINRVFQSGGMVGQKIADLLNGSWLGHPLHPVLTDVPIGAWTAAIALDTMEAAGGQRGIGQAADVSIAIGIAGAAGSAISGLADWQHTVGETRRTGFLHATLNTVALGLFIASLAARRDRDRNLGRNLALAGYAIAAASAYLGGDLVYRQKVGVNHAPEVGQIKAPEFTAVLSADQLPENRLTRASLHGTPLVLLRRGERVYALTATCAHLGGPLDEGQVIEGARGQPVVVCPWHGSKFDLDTGDIVSGPTAYAEPCLEARLRNGQVEVRHTVP